MLHLRIVTPRDRADDALDVLLRARSVSNVVYLPGAALSPKGDMILADVAREETSLVLADLRALQIPSVGSIAIEEIDTEISDASARAEASAPGAPADAVVWEEVEARTSENAELNGIFMIFMTLAMVLASIGIVLDSSILIVGAMIVGPEFGPVAGFCVAMVQRRRRLALRSLTALLVGFPVAIVATVGAMLVFKGTGVAPETFSASSHTLSQIIAAPGIFSFVIAFCSGVIGMLSLTSAKSGALIGVLISVTTIPSAANIAVAAVYGDTDAWVGSLEQLTINIAMLLVAGTLTLAVQRLIYRRRRERHRRAARGAPSGAGVG